MFQGLADKLISTFTGLITEIAKLSWVALIGMICIGGLLYLFGNEHGGKVTCRNAVYGWVIVQIANMLL